MKITIANAKRSDLPVIEEIAKAAYFEHKNKVSESLWIRWMGGVLESIRSGEGVLIVLKENHTIVGVIQFYDKASKSELDGWPSNVRAGALRIFAVNPKCQGKGYGAMLVKECIKRAKKLRLSKLFLHTGRINKSAIHLFEKLDFKRMPEFDFYPYGQKDQAAIAYCLEL